MGIDEWLPNWIINPSNQQHHKDQEYQHHQDQGQDHNQDDS